MTASVQKRNHSKLLKRIAKYRFLYLLGLPGIILTIIFKYVPMYGILIAFKDYNPFVGVWGSDWVGLQHFTNLFSDPEFYLMFKNTLAISLLTLATFPAPIFLALLLNEVYSSKIKKVVQTVVYMPHFLSWTVVIGITYLLLSSEQGIINKIIVANNGTAHAFLFDKNWFYPLLIIQKVWKGIGWGSIVYLAAISGVDEALYEAAVIDGANRFRQIISITIPSIMPTIITMFVLSLGSLVSVDFEHVYQMTNPMVSELANVFDTYVYTVGILGTQYSYTTAIGLFKSVISVALVLGSDYWVKKRGYSGVM